MAFNLLALVNGLNGVGQGMLAQRNYLQRQDASAAALKQKVDAAAALEQLKKDQLTQKTDFDNWRKTHGDAQVGFGYDKLGQQAEQWDGNNIFRYDQLGQKNDQFNIGQSNRRAGMGVKLLLGMSKLGEMPGSYQRPYIQQTNDLMDPSAAPTSGTGVERTPVMISPRTPGGGGGIISFRPATDAAPQAAATPPATPPAAPAPPEAPVDHGALTPEDMAIPTQLGSADNTPVDGHYSARQPRDGGGRFAGAPMLPVPGDTDTNGNMIPAIPLSPSQRVKNNYTLARTNLTNTQNAYVPKKFGETVRMDDHKIRNDNNRTQIYDNSVQSNDRYHQGMLKLGGDRNGISLFNAQTGRGRLGFDMMGGKTGSTSDAQMYGPEYQANSNAIAAAEKRMSTLSTPGKDINTGKPTLSVRDQGRIGPDGKPVANPVNSAAYNEYMDNARKVERLKQRQQEIENTYNKYGSQAPDMSTFGMAPMPINVPGSLPGFPTTTPSAPAAAPTRFRQAPSAGGADPYLKMTPAARKNAYRHMTTDQLIALQKKRAGR